MKIAVLIPDRSDRPQFLENCLRMMKAQTLQPEHIELVNDKPLNDKCDITYRYRTGYDRLRNKGYDLIAFIENDDWYDPDYLSTMAHAWKNTGRPQLLGTGSTIYYHIFKKRYLTMQHSTRSSAMNTFIVPNLNFLWCKDDQPYTDIHLWKLLKGVTVRTDIPISMGIKHGLGMCGGGFHDENEKHDVMHRFSEQDLDMKYLKKIMDSESFNFYSNLKK